MSDVASQPSSQASRSSEPSLLLIHGLGATAGVWADLVAELGWTGRVIVPDLPGHGSAGWSGDYTVGSLAASVSSHCDNGEEMIIVGHSLGGAVAVALASGFFRPVAKAVLGLGIKVAWSDADVAGMAKVAAKGSRWFDSRDEAVDRFLLQAGLGGIAGPDHPAVENAVAEEAGRWRTAQDPATFAQRPLDMRALMDAARCPVELGAGDGDAMVSEGDLAAYVHQPKIAVGAGHNVQVENPGWVADLIRQLDS